MIHTEVTDSLEGHDTEYLPLPVWFEAGSCLKSIQEVVHQRQRLLKEEQVLCDTSIASHQSEPQSSFSPLSILGIPSQLRPIPRW